MEKLQPPLNDKKQAKGTRTIVPEGDACLFADHV